MKTLFKTFKPKSKIVKKFVDYYYLDVKPNNITNEFQCFPHFNNTISLYKSHVRSVQKEMVFDKNAKPFQIFTPLRENILTVKQIGEVYRIVIVFHPLGIQQFYRDLDFSIYKFDYEFFSDVELQQLFSNTDTNFLQCLLDRYLEERFVLFEIPIIENTIQYIYNHYENFSVKELSSKLGYSRQYVNRVFKSQLGVSVKKFQEIVVFRKTIQKRLFENSSKNFTEMAYEFNFSDQSHLIKSYKALAQCSPKSFFEKGTLLGKKDTFWHLKD